MSGSGIRSIAVNAFFLATTRTITSVARVFYAALLAGKLGAQVYGQFNYGLSWYILFLPVSILGLNTLMVHEVGRNRAQSPTLIGQSRALHTLSSTIVAAFSLLLALMLESDPGTRNLLFIFSIALIGRSASIWANSVFKAYERSGSVMLLEVGFRLMEVTIGTAMLYLGYDIIALALLHTLSWMLQGFASMALLRRMTNLGSGIWAMSVFGRLISRGLPLVVGSMLMTWIMQGSILMYRHVGGMGADLGKLALALQALLIAGAITGEMITASLPVLARSVDRSDGKPGFYLAAVLSGGVLLSGSLVILALTVGPGLITAFIGKDYSETAALLPWTLALSAPCFWASALSNLIVAHDRYRTVTVINGLGAAIFTAAFMLLTPVFHLPGVILALAIGLLCVVAAQFVVLRRFYDFAFAGTITRALLAVVPGALVACLLVPVNSWLALSAGLAATGLLACWLGVVDLARMAKLRTAIFSARGSSLGRPSGD